jgi:hypothetical protein
MQAASRPYALAAAVLAATSAVAAIPLASRPLQLPIRSIETRLVDADSILNIPSNLFDDIANIPYYEVQALDTLAGSEFFTGTWWVADQTNLWGVDPGDPTHVAAVFSLLLPNPALSDPLIYQLDGLLAAELPVNASCDAAGCAPLVPTSPITDVTSIDQDIWTLEILTGQEKFPLIDDWFQVSELESGYNFGTVTDPSGSASGGFGFSDGTAPDGSANPFDGGTTPGPDGTDLMPWSNTTFTLNLLEPFENFYNSLLAPPSTDGIAGGSGIAIPDTGIELPTFTEFIQALQAVAAGTVVDFDPWTPGSPFCFGNCDYIPASETVPALVQDISNLDPGNPLIDEWLTDFANGTANWPSAATIQASIDILQQGGFDGGNPEPSSNLFTNALDPTQLEPYFNELWTALGINDSAVPGGLAALLGDATYDPGSSADTTTSLLATSLGTMFGGDTLGQALDQVINVPTMAVADLLGGLIP